MTSKRSLRLNLKSIILLKGRAGGKASLYAKIGWAIVILGILLRVYLYFFSPSYLNFAEMEAHQLYERCNLLEILFPKGDTITNYVGCMQYPFLFLIISKYLVLFLGSHLYILRLVPFLSGILALVLFNKLKDLFLPPLPGLMAIFLMATNWHTIHYGMMARPYSCDLLITIVLLLLFHNIRLSKEISTKKFVLYALSGIILVWFSNPSIFILAAGIIALGFSEVINVGKGRFNKKLFLMFLLWGLSFIINYWSRLRVHTLNDVVLTRNWKSRIFIDLGLWPSISLACKQFLGMFGYLLNMTPFLSLFLLIMGAIWFYRHKKYDFLIMILPFALTMAAAMMSKYAFFERLLLFLLPVLYIAICRGCWYVFFLTRSKIHRFTVLALCAFMIISPFEYIEKGMNENSMQDGIIPKFEYAFENFEEGDVYYMEPGLRFYFNFSQKTHQFPRKSYKIVSHRLSQDPASVQKVLRKMIEIEIETEIKELREFKRIWLFVHDNGMSLESVRLRHRLEGLGELRETRTGRRCSLYLYQLFSPGEEAIKAEFLNDF